ncbi:cation-translocating P-type ATPase [Pseudoalteromonas sp. MelDa3]|uniref:heavy metal translocating P-type ATPase n=1 Tax=Pseudoalteromonas sp. MelDa3 TaxID=888435 RepID=UPI000CC53E27|nr:heavy metal translocating P-type ATPase [Pseudoalteromonas sp. MelDa3]PLT25033.1 copper-translocating P-type ATPase [Pseudoalteromonas sp. MelDa3]
MNKVMKKQTQPNDEASCCGSCSSVSLTDNKLVEQPIDPAVAVDENIQTTQLRIQEMDCPTEEGLIRNKFKQNNQVIDLQFNLMQRTLTVVHTKDALPNIINAINELGFDAKIITEQDDNENIATAKISWGPLIIAGLLALSSEAVDWFGGANWLSAAFAILAVAISGLDTYKKGWLAIRGGNLNINALMSVAVTGALFIGQWPEAAMVMVLFTVSEILEAKSLDRARNAIAGLLQLTPETVNVQQGNGEWGKVPAKSVPLNSIVRVSPGERVALDGEIVSGRSTLDQAPITGESLPIEKTVGDKVFAGTINQSGSFEFKVTATANNTTVSRIIHAVEQAQGTKAPTQRFVDKFAQIYTPIVFFIALGVALIMPLFFQGNWFDWVYKALVILVIACPCALVISTPVTVVSGLAAAARKGILIKGGVYLEQGRNISWLALDKTGTITHGKPTQTNYIAIDATQSDHYRQLAASLADRSDHPVSRAIYQQAEKDSITLHAVENFEALLGTGVQGNIKGKNYYLGNQRLLNLLTIQNEVLQTQINNLEQQGKTVVMLTDNHQVLALFAVADTIKENSKNAIEQLHSMNIKTIMLTGDNQFTAQAIAEQAGIDQAKGEQLPTDKLNEIKQLMLQGKVAMVGDGINDAPALAQADIGFAMGAMGTDTAIETADVALMDDDLTKIASFILLSKNTHQILMQNIAFALAVKVIFFALTLQGSATMWMAVFADVGTSLLVVANGLRLLKK